MQQEKMAAIGSYRGLPIDDRESLQDVDVAVPRLRPRDVMVRVSAVSVNPADVKIRASLPQSQQPRILGFDAAGVVEATGSDVSTLSVGDEVVRRRRHASGQQRRTGGRGSADRGPEAGQPHIRRGRRAPADGHHGVGDPLRARFGLTSGSRGTLLVLGRRRRRIGHDSTGEGTHQRAGARIGEPTAVP